MNPSHTITAIASEVGLPIVATVRTQILLYTLQVELLF